MAQKNMHSEGRITEPSLRFVSVLLFIVYIIILLDRVLPSFPPGLPAGSYGRYGGLPLNAAMTSHYQAAGPPTEAQIQAGAEESHAAYIRDLTLMMMQTQPVQPYEYVLTLLRRKAHSYMLQWQQWMETADDRARRAAELRALAARADEEARARRACEALRARIEERCNRRPAEGASSSTTPAAPPTAESALPSPPPSVTETPEPSPRRYDPTPATSVAPSAEVPPVPGDDTDPDFGDDGEEEGEEESSGADDPSAAAAASLSTGMGLDTGDGSMPGASTAGRSHRGRRAGNAFQNRRQTAVAHGHDKPRRKRGAEEASLSSAGPSDAPAPVLSEPAAVGAPAVGPPTLPVAAPAATTGDGAPPSGDPSRATRPGHGSRTRWRCGAEFIRRPASWHRGSRCAGRSGTGLERLDRRMAAVGSHVEHRIHVLDPPAGQLAAWWIPRGIAASPKVTPPRHRASSRT